VAPGLARLNLDVSLRRRLPCSKAIVAGSLQVFAEQPGGLAAVVRKHSIEDLPVLARDVPGRL
jgi:hypothetical protein